MIRPFAHRVVHHQFYTWLFISTKLTQFANSIFCRTLKKLKVLFWFLKHFNVHQINSKIVALRYKWKYFFIILFFKFKQRNYLVLIYLLDIMLFRAHALKFNKQLNSDVLLIASNFILFEILSKFYNKFEIFKIKQPTA